MEDDFFASLCSEESTVARSIWAHSAAESDPVLQFLALLDRLASQVESPIHAQCLVSALHVSQAVLFFFFPRACALVDFSLVVLHLRRDGWR